jgi:glycosyltransferase involved in cell wall biosynthesis
MGEASGTLCEAFKYGKAVIVSDINQYKEFPNEVCWKVPVKQGEQECLTEMLRYLIKNRQIREILGENARSYAENVLAPGKIAKQYARIFSRIIEKKGNL